MKCIYGILNKINGNQYVGSAKNFYKRKRQHLNALKENRHHNLYLQNAWNKYGESMFEMFILEKVEDVSNLIEKEQWWINNSNSEYNICKIANSSLGIKRRPETIEKIRQANLGLKHPEWRNKIKSKAQGGENHWTKKKSFSDSAKKKMSESQKRLYKNGYIHPNRGKIVSEMSKLKMSVKKKKSILQLDLQGILVKEWESIKEASINGFNSKLIIECCKQRKNNYRNFIWKYKEKSV